MLLNDSLMHLRLTDCTRLLIFTRFCTNAQYPSHPPAEKSVCTFDLVLLVVYFSPEAEIHYIYFVSRYTCHAMGNSDRKESKVWVMPPEPALICMRVGAAL